MADYMVGRVVEHGERRSRELHEVAATLRTIGVEPLMAEAAARRQAWCAGLDLLMEFGGIAPNDYREVVRAIAEKQAASTAEEPRKLLDDEGSDLVHGATLDSR